MRIQTGMQDARQEFLRILKGSVDGCTSCQIALSGGLDSSAIAYMMRDRKPKAYAVIARDFMASDLTYCQMIASALDLRCRIVNTGTDTLVSAIDDTVKILGNFNDIEIRNALVMYVAVDAARQDGADSMVTGDGADEIFAGYDFMVKKSGRDLQRELDRISGIMHFTSARIGDALGVRIESPFLSDEMIEFAGNLPPEHMVGSVQGKRYGKKIIREAMQGLIPRQIVWRPKVPMQDGAGTVSMTSLFSGIIPDAEFHARQKNIMEADGIHVRTKESAIYYEAFRRIFGAPARNTSDNACPDCGTGVAIGSRFCRMCGRFPV